MTTFPPHRRAILSEPTAGCIPLHVRDQGVFVTVCVSLGEARELCKELGERIAELARELTS